MEIGTSENIFEEKRIIADPKQSPIRIDKFLMDRLPTITRNRLQNAIKAGAVTVNGKTIKPSYKLRPMDNILIIWPRTQPSEKIIAQDIPLDIVYEDAEVLVINKQAGLVVHPGIANPDGTLVNAIVNHLQTNNMPVLEGNSSDRPGLVHRIDKDTTGLMVIAKTDYGMSHLAKQFFDHSIDRAYTALVWGNFDTTEGTIEGNIGRHPRHRTQMAVFPEGDEGKVAITHYKLLEDFYYVSLVKCVLETGRTHQIRVHMKHSGHCVFNDVKYGGDSIRKGTVHGKYKQFVQNCFKRLPGHALHASTLGFVHPASEEYMKFEVAPPIYFQEVVEKWRRYIQHRKVEN